MSGPGFTTEDAITIGAFALNYAVVAPISVVCLVVALVRRKRHVPRWLFIVAAINLLVVVPQLVFGGRDMETWLLGLLTMQAVAALGMVAWVVRARGASQVRAA